VALAVASSTTADVLVDVNCAQELPGNLSLEPGLSSISKLDGNRDHPVSYASSVLNIPTDQGFTKLQNDGLLTPQSTIGCSCIPRS